MLELLGVNRNQLDRLRYEKGFPYIHLGQKTRVYLASDVLDFIKSVLVQDKRYLDWQKGGLDGCFISVK
jgi:hypothetical protein